MPWSISDEQVNRWTEFVRQLFGRMKRISARRRVRVTVLAVVLPLFGVALIFAWMRAGIAFSDLAFLPMLVVVAAVPLGVIVSTWQLHAMTRAGGVGIHWWRALRVVTLSSLSSLFPITSGTVVRGGAVVVWGVAPRTAGIVLALDAVLWTCISLIYSGLAAFLASAPALGTAFLVSGLLLVPIPLALGRTLPGEGGGTELAWARFVGILVQVVRLYASFLALGFGVTVVEASTLVAASPLASLLFFLPGGLGIREGFVSAVALAVGLNAAGAFLAAALNRLIGLSVLLVWEGILLATSGRRIVVDDS